MPSPAVWSRRDAVRLGARSLAAGVAVLAFGERRAVAARAIAAPADRSLTADGRVFSAGRGGWCWFQSPRALIAPDGTLWFGSTTGRTSEDAGGDVEVVAVDLTRGVVRQRHRLGTADADDHMSPSLTWTGGDRPQAAWATHAGDDWFEVGTPGRQLQRVVRPASTLPPGTGVSYTITHLVGGERWLLYRGERHSWFLMTSVDDGSSWQPAGLVVEPGDEGGRPYVVATSDGRRLHVLVSDGNPAEVRGSGVGYVVVDRRLRILDSYGTEVGRVGGAPVSTRAASRLVDGTSAPSEAFETDWWMCDLQVIDRRPTAILSVRDPWPPTARSVVGGWRHRYVWAQRAPAGDWVLEDLAWAGSELLPRQPDYTGLAALDPSSTQGRVVVSTDVHPVTGLALRSARDGEVHRELWQGERRGSGGWAWTALTVDSAADNLRPIVVAGSQRTALLWMRGRYDSFNDFDTTVMVRVVGAPRRAS